MNLWNDGEDERFKYMQGTFKGVDFYEKVEDVDKRLFDGQIPVIQLHYEFREIDGSEREVQHAFPIVGKINNEYIVNDEYYPQNEFVCGSPGGLRFTTLNNTINSILDRNGLRGAEFVRINMLSFYQKAAIKKYYNITEGDSSFLNQCTQYNLYY